MVSSKLAVGFGREISLYKIRRGPMHYYFYLGTMAELIKMMGVLKEFSDRKIPYKVVLSGQHELRDSDLWEIIGKKDFEFVLYDRPVKKSIFAFALWALQSLFNGVRKLQNEFKSVDRKQVVWVISCDTISTGLGALLGFIFRLKIAHVEAGLTSGRMMLPFPEEMTRNLSSRVSSYLFCSNQWGVDNLKGYSGRKINTFQNTIADSLKLALAIPPQNSTARELQSKDFFVFSIHRQENIYNKKIFQFLIEEVIKASQGFTCVFMMYDLTLMKISELGLMEKLKANPNILLVPRMPYLEYMHLLKSCKFLITDGGSNQEDSYLLGKPCLILREVTERTEGLGENVELSMNSAKKISNFIRNYKSYERKPILIDHSPSRIIVDTLVQMS
jgi:UDP-N-acetylglucosamine 2-epimerase (non-hydrolysing)